MEEAQIPARSVTILPAAGTAMPPAAASSAGTPATAAASAGDQAAAWWRWLALGSIGLWLLSMLGWLLWRWRRHASTAAAPVASPASTRSLQLAFIAAARGSDSAAQVRTLLAWARAERPALQHLGELATALADERQCAAIAALQQQRYAGRPIAGDAVDMAAAFKRGFAWRTDAAVGNDVGLPPLYPFELHPEGKSQDRK